MHPDAAEGNQGLKESEKFKDVTNAYNILSDSKLKHQYDLKR
jgi:DnaJ-class molecular chaperone